nr:uncharacterized protein LOC114819434 isoform X1 [Malus domestica]
MIRTHLSRTIDFKQFGTHRLLLHCVSGDNPVEQNYYLHYDNHAFDEYCKLEYPSVPKRKRFLRVVGMRGSEYFLWAYSLARGLWSSPCSFDPVCKVFYSCKFQAFVNWAVHWLAWRCLNDGRYQNFILAIDVDGDGNSVAMFTTTRGRNCPEDFLDIWVMKEYGIEDSWAKLITLSPPDPERRVPYKPLCFRNNGEVVS